MKTRDFSFEFAKSHEIKTSRKLYQSSYNRIPVRHSRRVATGTTSLLLPPPYHPAKRFSVARVCRPDLAFCRVLRTCRMIYARAESNGCARPRVILVDILSRAIPTTLSSPLLPEKNEYPRHYRLCYYRPKQKGVRFPFSVSAAVKRTVLRGRPFFFFGSTRRIGGETSVQTFFPFRVN